MATSASEAGTCSESNRVRHLAHGCSHVLPHAGLDHPSNHLHQQSPPPQVASQACPHLTWGGSTHNTPRHSATPATRQRRQSAGAHPRAKPRTHRCAPARTPRTHVSAVDAHAMHARQDELEVEATGPTTTTTTTGPAPAPAHARPARHVALSGHAPARKRRREPAAHRACVCSSTTATATAQPLTS